MDDKEECMERRGRVEGEIATFPHVSQENSLMPRLRRPLRRSGASCTTEREGAEAAGMVRKMESLEWDCARV